MTTTDIKTMNADEDYGFDIFGFIHLQQVLTAKEVAACNQAIDGAGQEMPLLQELLEHPILQNYVKALCGDAFSLDRPPSLVTGSETNGKETFSAGDPETNRRLRYICHGDVRVCNGLRVIVALAPSSAEGGLVLVPASHKRVVPPSANFLSGAGDIGMTEQPALAAGDVLLCAATTISAVRGRPQRLLEMRYISGRVMPTDGFPEVEAPDWMAELTPEQKAVVGLRTTGRGGKVISDREKIWVADEVEQPASVSFNLDEYSMPDPDELWFWDIRGYLVVRGVMDAEWLAAANAAIDFAAANAENLPEGHPSAIEEVPEQALRENDWEWPEGTSPRLRGEINRPRIGGLYQLPAPHCDPFRRMIAHPAVAQRLNWMLGYGFREGGEPMCCVYPKGTTGGWIQFRQRPATGRAGQCRLGPARRGRGLRREQRRFPLCSGQSQGHVHDSGASAHEYRSAPGLQARAQSRRRAFLRRRRPWHHGLACRLVPTHGDPVHGFDQRHGATR